MTTNEDVVLETMILPAWAGSWADVLIEAEINRTSAEVARQVRSEKIAADAARHDRLRTSLIRLGEARS